jgi:hypothetical protein
MKRILLRSRKDPFEVVQPEDALLQNMVAGNAGNLLFSVATHKILETADTQVTADRLLIKPGQADLINERYDAYVIPLANAIRPSYESNLIRLTALIRRLRIPVVILGVGAQASLRHDTRRLATMSDSVRAFVAAVLDRSPSIGVRGEFTHDYLRGLGFGPADVEVIGCPSMFIDGDRLHVERRVPALDTGSRLAINVSPYVKKMGPVVRHHVERYPDLTYIAQDIATLELLLWGDSGTDVDPGEDRPIHIDHPLFRDDKTRYFLDPWPWLRFLATRDFSFGTRIHGNIAALMAGTPAFVLAHDSRTLELVRYFEIPHRLMSDVTPDLDAADLYAEADYGPLTRGHAARFATFAAFLERHGLDHVFASPPPDPDFETRMDATPFPPAVTVASVRDTSDVRGRIKRLRRRIYRLSRAPWVRRTRVALMRGGARLTGRGATSGERSETDDEAPEA